MLGNFLLPLRIGTDDLQYPRLNLASWYIFMAGAALTLFSLIRGGVDTGWTFYTPYSTTYTNSHVILMAAGIFVAGFSSIATGLNFIVTIHRRRAPGMHWGRLPLFVWSLYGTSLILVLATPALAITLLLIALERLFGVGVFDPAIAVLSFFVWGHHMFVSSQSVYAGLIFSFLSFLVAIPSAVKVFNWTATLHRGSISFETPMRYALGFIGLFVVGGLTGLFLATIPVDVHVHDTYFIVAHFHYIMVGGMVMAFLVGLHAVHMTAGILFLSWLWFRAPHRDHVSHAVEITGLYWHFVDIIRVFLFPLLYLVA